METLTYGYLKPENGDRGSIFWDALAGDIDRLNSHDHDGLNSPQLSSTAITPVSNSIVAGGWVDQGGGTYRQLVNTPPSISVGAYGLAFRITSSGHEINPTVEKVSVSSFYVYVNDNSIGLDILYLV